MRFSKNVRQSRLYALEVEELSNRNDVERAFGVLQSRFAIVAGPARIWRKERLHDIMTSCIIMHNMIVEDECAINVVIEEQLDSPNVGVEMMNDNDGEIEQRRSAVERRQFAGRTTESIADLDHRKTTDGRTTVSGGRRLSSRSNRQPHLDNILRAQGKLYVLDKPVSRPKSNSPKKEFTQYFKYLEDESDVMSILIFSISPELARDLRVKSCHEVVQDIENQLGFYKHMGKLLIMKEILSLKLRKDQSIKDHLIEMRRLFKCLTRLGYKMTQEELVYLMWYSLPKEICDTASAYMKEPKIDMAKVHEDILASLEPKPAPDELMDSDWIDELGDLSCPECGSQDICEHSMNIDQIEIGLPDAPGIFMIDCLITSYESWVIDTSMVTTFVIIYRNSLEERL
ncbi:hypothetical protein OSB04_020626 [Centaurea solstitialis]|uniref:Uncharacterized protein n=1 Tax=Centaurea solstitialis TaxID=347529 RepID=A0AA38ST13_9ASTR|nr:hypothetical protein OSB04_020626 [Centaurea solstitialis]